MKFKRKMTDVIKRSGAIETFNLEKAKVSVKKAMLDANLCIDEHRCIIDDVSKKIFEIAEREGIIDTVAIREKILEHLDAEKKDAADSWRRFDIKYKL